MLLSARYQVGPRLGAGGQASVFRAQDLEAGTEVAVRILDQPKDEATASVPPAELHPAWVRKLDAGRDPVRGPYAVFELIEGATLAERVARSPLALDEWRRLASEASDALSALHAAGWVHGDLNGFNLMREASSGRWRVLELPFHSTAAAPAFGHAETLAPEQIDGRAPDARSDFYALGCLLYLAAAGRYPFPGESMRQILIDKLRHDPVPLTELLPSFPADDAARVMALLRRDPDERPMDAFKLH